MVGNRLYNNEEDSSHDPSVFCFVFIEGPVMAEITHCEFDADICVLILVSHQL